MHPITAAVDSAAACLPAGAMHAPPMPATRLLLAVRLDPTPSITDWLTAIGTIGTGIVAIVLAIWGDEVRLLWRRPKLAASIEMAPPDCHPLTRLMAELPIDGYYFRLSIGNNGRRRAQDVMVRLLALELRDADGAYRPDPDFRPFNLKWAHTDDVAVPRIDPFLPRHCDLCHIWNRPGQPLLLEFDTEVEPNQIRPDVWPTKKSMGNYRITIAVTATNARPLQTTLRIRFSGRWFDRPDEMFSQGLVIEA